MSSSGLYIHVPFCRSKCPYCAFYSIASVSMIPQWVNGLKKEIALYKGLFNRFDTLYLGGGTPTSLDIEILSDIMGHIRSGFDFTDDSEITIEANPSDLTPEKIMALSHMGFNRISLGVQSFNDITLGFLGRTHLVRDVEKSLSYLAESDFENIGMDLIYGFEGQSLEDWIITLKKAITYVPRHLSCYQLTVEEKTPFFRLKEKGLFKPLGQRQEASFFLATSQFLEDKGFVHYEVSSFARDARFFSRHNRKYWQHTPYLGLGPSAHSFYKGRRWWNVKSVRRYCEALERDVQPVEGYEVLSDEDLALERIVLGLRTRSGVDRQSIPSSYQSNRMLSQLCNSGFLVEDRGRIMPTRKGLMVADYMAYSLG